jgi:uncharacterized protein YjeT (DUF2065 family)
MFMIELFLTMLAGYAFGRGGIAIATAHDPMYLVRKAQKIRDMPEWAIRSAGAILIAAGLLLMWVVAMMRGAS